MTVKIIIIIFFLLEMRIDIYLNKEFDYFHYIVLRKFSLRFF